MACTPALVARRAWQDARDRWGGRVYYLGICPSPEHLATNPTSDHNRGMAVDIGVNDDQALGDTIVRSAVRDRRLTYAIYRAKGYRALWRGGSTFGSKGHWTHVHLSFRDAYRYDTSPFFGAAYLPPIGEEHEVTKAEMDTIILNTIAGTMAQLDERMKNYRLEIAAAVDAVLKDDFAGVDGSGPGPSADAIAQRTADVLHERLAA